ncbi:MAG: PCRF domain-containing protein, partial [Bacteroidaceae bacterium]|nr:PCRF domain-containing protein [Bacteroidaceae bacterium]
MVAENNILTKLEGLVARYEEISTLITDPNVIADQKRYVKLTKEYKDLSELMRARKEYIQCMQNADEARELLASEDDPEMRDMAREELQTAE